MKFNINKQEIMISIRTERTIMNIIKLKDKLLKITGIQSVKHE